MFSSLHRNLDASRAAIVKIMTVTIQLGLVLDVLFAVRQVRPGLKWVVTFDIG